MKLLDYIEDLVRQAEMRDPREGPLMIHVGDEVEDALRAELGEVPAEVAGHRLNPFKHSIPQSDQVLVEGWPYDSGPGGGDFAPLFFHVTLPLGLEGDVAETYLRLRKDGMPPEWARGSAIALERAD